MRIYKTEILLSILYYQKKKNSGYDIRMLKITIDNCCKCNLEAINDPNNSQYFWIYRIDLGIEAKRNWQVIFDIY